MSSSPSEAESRPLLPNIADKADSLSILIQKELATYSSSSPCEGYLDPSDPSMITAADRKVLVDWCYGIVDHFRLSRESVAMAMAMVDRFLDMPSCTIDAARAADGSLHSQEKFQLLAIVALYCSIKANEKQVTMSSNVFVDNVCSDLYTKEEIEDMEHILFRSGLMPRCNDAPTAYQVGHSILSVLVPHVSMPEATWAFLLDEMKYQTEHAVRDYYFATQRTSTIAIAAVLNAVQGISSTEKRQEMLGALLVRIMDCFDFDHSSVISAAKNRLQRLVQGDIIGDEEGSNFADIFLKPLSGDHEENLDWDEFMKTIESDCASKPMRSQPATKPIATAVRAIGPKSISILMKPMRPLPAYLMYSQLEKEFIIQSMAGEDANKSTHDNKVYLDYVPERYRKTKLSPEWYFRSCKKTTKRKHRKQHGKISFVELSRTIASRWAKLDETNPDIKSFVEQLANRELEEFRRDLEEYNKLMDNMAPTPTASEKKNTKRTLEGRFKNEENAPQKSSRLVVQSKSCPFERHEEGGEQEEDIDQSLPFLDLKRYHYRPASVKYGRREEVGLHHEDFHVSTRRISDDNQAGVENFMEL
jgi:hypothetical protein